MSEIVSGTRRAMREKVDGSLVVQIEIDPRFRADFLRLFSEIDMPVALVPLVADFERKQDTRASTVRAADDNGHYISALYRSGFWSAPKVLAVLRCNSDEAHQRLREQLGVKSLTEVSPKTILEWAMQNGVDHCLPLVFKE